MQVDPIKPTLKAPRTKRLKLKCDEWLSDFAFNFNLCRYIKVRTLSSEPLVMVVDDVFRPDTARRCRLTPSNPR